MFTPNTIQLLKNDTIYMYSDGFADQFGGVKGKKYLTKNCQASIINNPNFKNRTQKIRDDRHGPTSWISITITEGKFRQVRKMTAAVGFPTLRLIRVRIGEVLLEGIDLGEVKEVKSFV